MAARNEAERIRATVQAIRSIAGVDEVLVVDDASSDSTASIAAAAGARVVVAPRRLGKGGAVDVGIDRAGDANTYLLLDADLGASATEAATLLSLVSSGEADLAIGALAPDPMHGGFGIVRRLSAAVIRGLSGFRASAPLSGQRAASRTVIEAVRPLARGFGLETAMTVDAVRAGFTVREVPVGMRHAATGRTLQGFAHRARQGRDILLAALPRIVGRP